MNTLDAEQVKRYEATAIVEDGAGRNQGLNNNYGESERKFHTDTQKLVFNIKDVNEHAPKFTLQAYNLLITEGGSPHTVVGKLSATDQDRDSKIVFEIVRDSFTPRLAENEALPFTIKAMDDEIDKKTNRRRTTVELLAVKSLDREDIIKYNFRVRALDKNRESCTTKDNCASWVDVTVTVEDINDNTPVLCRKYSQAKASGNPNIRDMYCATDSQKLNLKFCSATANTMIAQIDASDDDEGDNGRADHVLAGKVTTVGSKRKM